MCKNIYYTFIISFIFIWHIHNFRNYLQECNYSKDFKMAVWYRFIYYRNLCMKPCYPRSEIIVEYGTIKTISVKSFSGNGNVSIWVKFILECDVEQYIFNQLNTCYVYHCIIMGHLEHSNTGQYMFFDLSSICPNQKDFIFLNVLLQKYDALYFSQQESINC